MLALLDTTAILSDPHLAGLPWRILAGAATHWGLQIVVPEVAVAEAVAGYQRDVGNADEALRSWATKFGRLDAETARQQAAQMLTKQSAAYPAQLRELLTSVGAAIAPPPDVPHMTIVDRAANRRRPCNQRGDGYRDTLNWLTLLELAAEHPDEQIIWVSNNTQDFGNGQDTLALHQDLLTELAEANLDTRVRWVRDLKDLVLALAAEHAPGSNAELAEIHAEIQRQAVLSSITTEVLSKLHGRPLDVQRCGLARGTTSAWIDNVSEPRTLTIARRGPLPDKNTVIEFSVTAGTSILVTVPPGIAQDDGATRDTSPDNGHGITATISKQLEYSGILTIDAYDHFIDAELADIEAPTDDPGIQAWTSSPPLAVLNLSSDALASMFSNPSNTTLAAMLIWMAIQWYKNKPFTEANFSKLWPPHPSTATPKQPEQPKRAAPKRSPHKSQP